MWTSYFGKIKQYKEMGNYEFVSIARFNRFFNGRCYKELAPPPELLKIESEKEYTKLYYQMVLNKLDPVKVYSELGDNSVLVCYEKYADIKNKKTFCHRRIVAKWLEENIKGLEVKEFEEVFGENGNNQLSFEID